MPIDRITFAQYVDKLRTALLSRTRRYDTGYGPILDVVLRPVAAVLEDQNNNRLRQLSLLLSLQNSDEFSEADLEALVFNEGITRPSGSSAVATLVFRRRTPFATGDTGVIPRGFPVGSSVHESTGQAVTFITTESRTKSTAIAVLDTETNTTVYENHVPAVAILTGTIGQVGPDRINRPLRPLVGYDEVTNDAATQEGRDRFTNEELIELYLLAVSSRQLSVPSGSEFHVRSAFDAVEDVHEVFGSNPLLTRAATDAGAVDAFIVGQNLLTKTEYVTFLGTGQKLTLSTPPVVRVDSVKRVSDSALYTETDDYEVSLDISGVRGSTRAKDGIRFLPGADPAPAVGDSIQVVYAYNQLIRDLQDETADPRIAVNGRDLLFRQGDRVDIFLNAQLVPSSGFTPADILDAVVGAVGDFINALELGDDVEASDIQGVVRKLTGVDNFIITKLVRDATTTGTSDVSIADNEYARIDTDTNLVVTLI